MKQSGSEKKEPLGTANRRGYLNEPFRVFQLADQRGEQYEYHSHAFEKIILFSGGKVNYRIEGRSYDLNPGDVLLIQDDDLHSPVIDRGTVYRRTVIWVGKEFLNQKDEEGFRLDACFQKLRSQGGHRISLEMPNFEALNDLLGKVVQVEREGAPGWSFLKNAYFMEAMVLLNRLTLNGPEEHALGIHPDPEIGRLLDYIGTHLSEPLSVPQLAERLHLSPSQTMNRFKEATGFTLHQYLVLKRLAMAKRGIHGGMRMTEAALDAGFSDYSTFLRAFRKHHGISPRAYFKHSEEDPLE